MSLRGQIAAALVLGLGCSALLVGWYRQVSARHEAVAIELRKAKAQWAALSPGLKDARAARVRFDSVAHRAREVIQESGQVCWSSALQGIVAATKDGIQLQDIRASRSSEFDGWSLRVVGLSRGAAARAEANTFRLNLEQALRKAFGVEISARFALPTPVSNPSDDLWGPFTIEAAIQSAAPSKAEAQAGA